MRIIAKERDYYDCIQAQGQDLTCVWVRKLEKVLYDKKVKRWPFKKFKAANLRYNGSIYAIQYVIGFCGKIYHVIGVGESYYGDKTFCYSLEDFDNFVRDNYDDKKVKIYYSKDRTYHRPKGDVIGISHKDVREFFTKAEEEKNSFEDIFIENGCPVFVAELLDSYRDRELKIIYHGRKEDPERPDDNAKEIDRNSGNSTWYDNNFYMLKDFEFYRIFPTQQAFQEIWQYISGVLGANNPDVPVPDDETMRDIKGFDNWSFKKMPTKKK